MTRRIAVQQEAIDALEVEQCVSHPEAGAVVTFIGRVRNHNDEKPVTRLEYEAYPSMAVREMSRIVEGIEQRIPGSRLAVVHRVGSLEVGDAAIVCAASAAHRAEAFEACRLLIDEVKASVPIWKREFGPDGPYWVGWQDARCLTHGKNGSAHTHEHHKHAVSGAGQPWKSLRAACITVSDTRNAQTDVSGNIIEELLSEAGATVERMWSPDEIPLIVGNVQRALAASTDVIVLTGGTGLGPRDVTAEAVRPLLERTLDGFGESFRRLSFDEVGVRSIVSRAVAGCTGQTLIFALPGSSKAVRLAVEQLIIPLVPHAKSMLRGGGHE